jgi:hypothetical protein
LGLSGPQRPKTTLNELLVPVSPPDCARRLHPTQRPVTLRPENRAIPFEALTCVSPFKPPTAMGPSSESVTVSLKLVARFPLASRASTVTLNELFNTI